RNHPGASVAAVHPARAGLARRVRHHPRLGPLPRRDGAIASQRPVERRGRRTGLRREPGCPRSRGASMSAETLPPPLAGVRVLDLSTVFMGPYAAQILAEWGADVIKVEALGGDQVRGIGDTNDTGVGPVFVNANRGKRSVAVDLKTDAGREVLHALVREADLLIHNVRPPAAARLGITWEDLREVNPRLVLCAFRGYGAGGPYADRPAYDDVIQAASGVASAQAAAGDEPGYWRSAASDKVMGIYGAAAACAALRAREVDGTGRAVEIPMFEGMASFMLLDRQGGWLSDPPTGPTGYPRTDSPHRRPYAT